MRGTIKRRSKGSWTIRVDNGVGPSKKDPTKIIRKRIVVTFRGTKKKAQKRLTDILKNLDDGTYVDASDLTLGQWLDEWLQSRRARIRPTSYERYNGIIENSIQKNAIANIPLQSVRASHIERYYATATVSPATLTLHHAILHGALRKAKRDQLIVVNPAIDLEGRPRRSRDRSFDDARTHCWSATEARVFLAVAKAAGTQPAAFYSLALDSGARKGELCGLQWTDLDLDAGKMRIVRQLLSPTVKQDGTLDVGPTKTGNPRTVSLAKETIELLRAHRKSQRELLMANRNRYHDYGLVFAKEWSDVQRRVDVLGHPLQTNNLGQREYTKLIKAAGIRAIKFHGLRHTCATLLLQAGQPVHVVSERLGHSKVSMTMEVYAHVLPDMQQDAAAKLGALLHG
jgi:integrase